MDENSENSKGISEICVLAQDLINQKKRKGMRRECSRVVLRVCLLTICLKANSDQSHAAFVATQNTKSSQNPRHAQTAQHFLSGSSHDCDSGRRRELLGRLSFSTTVILGEPQSALATSCRLQYKPYYRAVLKQAADFSSSSSSSSSEDIGESSSSDDANGNSSEEEGEEDDNGNCGGNE